VNETDGYAGLFALATPVEGNPPGTLVQVTVSVPNPSQLVLDLSSRQVLTDPRSQAGQLRMEPFMEPSGCTGGNRWQIGNDRALHPSCGMSPEDVS
jgi:hypothetical protein